MGKHSVIRSAAHCANISAAQRGLPLPYPSVPGAEKSRQLRRRRQGAVIWYKMLHPCVDCGCSEPRVLDFDHVRGEKSFNLQQAKQRPLALTLEEIQKCDVVCANCHRLRTQGRMGSTAWAILIESL